MTTDVDFLPAPAPCCATAAYLYVLDLDGPALAWELLRRNPGYGADWQKGAGPRRDAAGNVAPHVRSKTGPQHLTSLPRAQDQVVTHKQQLLAARKGPESEDRVLGDVTRPRRAHMGQGIF